MITDFIFDGRTLSSMGYMLIFENQDDKIDVSNITFYNVKGSRNDCSYRAGYKYETNYTGTYYIMKNICDNTEDQDMDDDDISELTRWLCRKQYKWFRFIDPDNDDIWYQVYCTVKKEELQNKAIGVELTINTNAPYGFSREIVSTYTTTASSKRFKLFMNSDEEGYIYPDVTIKVKESGDLRFKNVTEGRITALDNCVAGETITFLGNIQQINSTVKHDFIEEYNYKIPRLHNLYTINENIFECNLNCDITFKYREVRKVGLK